MSEYLARYALMLYHNQGLEGLIVFVRADVPLNSAAFALERLDRIADEHEDVTVHRTPLVFSDVRRPFYTKGGCGGWILFVDTDLVADPVQI